MMHRLHCTRMVGAAVVVWTFIIAPSGATPIGVETRTAPAADTSPIADSPGARSRQLTSEARPQLVMVLIRAPASEIPHLRKMPLDIIRMTPVDADRRPVTKDDFLSTTFVLEAVAPVSLLPKLRALGLEVVEVP